MEENIWTNFNFNTLSNLGVVAGEQRLHIFAIFRRWSLASLDEFVVRMVELSLNVLLHGKEN